MRPLHRRLYRLILRLHPASFRNQFAREMSLDFEDALRFYGPAHLFRDALASLARQWSTSILSTAPEPIATPRPSLLAGNYIMVRDEPFSPLELARGLTASAALLTLCALGLNAGPRHPPPWSAVYAGTTPENPTKRDDDSFGTQAVPSNRSIGATVLYRTSYDYAPTAYPREDYDSRSSLHRMQQKIRIAPSLSEAAISAQAPSSIEQKDAPTFEAVSVRLNESGKGFALGFTPDGFIATNMPLQLVILNAYNLRDQELAVAGKRIPGGPAWINSDRYDIQAKMSESDIANLNKLSSDQQLMQERLMLRTMLADRFKLHVHSAIGMLPGYELVVDKSGSKLKEATTDETASGHFLGRPGTITATGASLTQLVFALSGPLHSPVVDKTGLDGRYDFMLRYSPDTLPPPVPGGAIASPDTFGPSIFTAVQEQLGLKLQSAKVPVESIVIDHIERPSPN